MSPRPLLRLAAALVAGTLAGCMTLAVVLAPAPLPLATGTPGGDYQPVGNAVCRMFNLGGGPEARPCIALPSAGSVENLRRVRRGEAAFAMAQMDVAHAAFRGDGPFASAGPDPKLRMLIALHPEAFTVLARADAGLRDLRDVRGQRVGLGKSGAGSPFTRDVVLAAYGWSTADLGAAVELDPGEQDQALCGNRVDVVFFVAGHPNGVTQAATAACAATLVAVSGPPVDRLLATRSWYFASFIPGGMYAGNPTAVATIGTRAVLLASSDLSDAHARAVVQAVVENLADFRRLHPVLAALERRDLAALGGVIPMHPGARAYYREVGLLPPATAGDATPR